MTTRSSKERLREATHIVVRADASGKCEFLNKSDGSSWTKLQYLGLRFTEEKANQIAEKVKGMAIPFLD